MTDFIAAIAPGLARNWQICKRERLWGVVGRGNNWRTNVLAVEGGDRVFVWQGGNPNGFIAELRALEAVEMVGPTTKVPWPNPERFGGVFAIEVVAETSTPLGDRFPDDNGRFGLRYGFNNTALQHIFEEISPDIAALIAADLAPHRL